MKCDWCRVEDCVEEACYCECHEDVEWEEEENEYA